MKRKSLIFPSLVFGLVLILGSSCKKESLGIPHLVTTIVSDITYSSASSGGDIISDGGSVINTRGVCWSTGLTSTISDNKTTDGSGAGNYSSNITGLSAGTTYYLRAYATNNVGTAYGETISFTTLQVQDGLTVSDIDGNIYNTVTIGTQVWMAENLKTTKYRNGDPIPYISGETWHNLTAGAYCIYDNNEDNRLTYGHLYNWYAANDDRNICPEGWHLPTMEEWATLSETGLEVKESGTSHWMSPNLCKPNASGFNALPGGGCHWDGSFNGLSEYGWWWTASEEDTERAWDTSMYYQNAGVSGWSNAEKYNGSSIRCIKD